MSVSVCGKGKWKGVRLVTIVFESTEELCVTCVRACGHAPRNYFLYFRLFWCAITENGMDYSAIKVTVLLEYFIFIQAIHHASLLPIHLKQLCTIL